MESRHSAILQNMQRRIVHDLDIRDIIDNLIEKRIVSPALWREIANQTSESQNRILLDLLPRSGPRAYAIFKESMRDGYKWISEKMDKLENTEDCVDSLDASFGTNILLSYLPENPPLSIKRTQKMEKLQQGLTELKPGNYLVLHALRGYGKSTLASATLREKTLVDRLFKNEIYWIKFGECQSMSENILIQLNMLFHRVRNLESLTEPTSEDSLKYSLKRHFSEHSYALIILDDVNSQDVIDAFDFGCKTLVLTTDVDILRGKQCNVIEMCDGFCANESLDLFAKATGIPVSKLPNQARQIHEECRGMPLMISMFSARFEEIKESLAEGPKSDKIWSYYLKVLQEKKSSVFQEPLQRLAAIFDLCIKTLDPEDQRYYKSLAIFPEDVNIPTETLAIFWGVEFAEVDVLMFKFYKKSLACRMWHKYLNTYVYGVHNLVLCHLREKLGPEELEKLHRSYVEKNLKSCNGDFSKLPTDNYFHSYIGYHMEKGGLKDKFSDLYLNFAFIEAKIFHVGPGDLLIDLKKYRNYITQNSPELSHRVEDLETFLLRQASTLAEYRKRNCLDLVQVALKHPFDGFVRKTAESLANERQNCLYLNHLQHSTEYLHSYSEELHLQVKSVAFTNDPDVILVGNDEGKVVLWNCYNKKHVTFYGNNREMPITKIVAPDEEKFFITISADGTAKLFDLPEDSVRQKNNDFNTLHPRAKQSEWINMSASKFGQDDSKITFSIPREKIVDLAVSLDGNKIAACTDAGTVAMWDYFGKTLVQPQSVAKNSLTSIAFSMCSTLLHVVNVSVGSVIILDATNARYEAQFSLHPESEKIISLLSVPLHSNLLFIVLETKLCQVSWALDGDRYQGRRTKIFAELGDQTITYTCATVTRDGKYIVTADSSSSVNVYDHKRSEVVRTYQNLVFSLDTYWIEDKSCHIICGGNRDTLVPMVHRWKFYPTEKTGVQRLPLFDATMEPGERNVIAVATSDRTVQIIQNDIEIAKTPAVTEKITSLLISKNGNHVVYGTESGSVYLFDIKLNHSKLIMELSKSVQFIKILKIDEEVVIVCEKGGENLQIWKNTDDTQLVEYTGAVIFCDLLESVQRILTVAKTVLKIWDPKSWKLQLKLEAKFVPNISCCSLSQKQTYLSLGNATGKLNVFKLTPRENLRAIIFKESMKLEFNEGITACSFSQDEQFLGLGFKSGNISIFRVPNNFVICKLELHRQSVKELHWGPPDLDEPVLLSLANELAWWSVPTQKGKKQAHREISHSLSELTISRKSENSPSLGTMRTSKSLEFGNTQIMGKVASTNNGQVFLTDESSHSNYDSETDLAQSLNALNGEDQSSVSSVWNLKKPKYPKFAGLLSVVKLDGDFARKVCVSKDFSNFLTLNTEGSIYNLKIFEYRKGDNINGNT